MNCSFLRLPEITVSYEIHILQAVALLAVVGVCWYIRRKKPSDQEENEEKSEEGEEGEADS